jgi:phosphate uptake regulator
MRDSYREQLDDILADLVHMSQIVSAAVRTSTTALLEADIHLAARVPTQVGTVRHRSVDRRSVHVAGVVRRGRRTRPGSDQCMEDITTWPR